MSSALVRVLRTTTVPDHVDRSNVGGLPALSMSSGRSPVAEISSFRNKGVELSLHVLMVNYVGMRRTAG